MSEVVIPSSIDPEDLRIVAGNAAFGRRFFRPDASCVVTTDKIEFYAGEKGYADGTVKIAIDRNDPKRIEAYSRKDRSDEWVPAVGVDPAMLEQKTGKLMHEAAEYWRTTYKEVDAGIAAQKNEAGKQVNDLLAGL